MGRKGRGAGYTEPRAGAWAAWGCLGVPGGAWGAWWYLGEPEEPGGGGFWGTWRSLGNLGVVSGELGGAWGT